MRPEHAQILHAISSSPRPCSSRPIPSVAGGPDAAARNGASRHRRRSLIHLGRTPVVELYDGGGGLPYLGSATSYNAGDWEPALRTFHDSGVYDTELAQIDKLAEKAVLRSVAQGRLPLAQGALPQGPRPGARGARSGHGKKLALVLDIDETSLSNYTAIDADNFTFGPNSQAEATNETGMAIPSTLELFNLAKQNGVAVFFITGRRENTRAHTESNLTREGYDGLAAAGPQAGRVDRHHRRSTRAAPARPSRSRATASSPTSATSTPTWPAATRTSGSSSPTRSTSCHRLAAWPATSTCSTPLSCVTSSPACAPRSRTPDRPRRPATRSGPRFAELLADPDWLPERFQEGDPESGMGGGIGQWLLFRAGDRSLSLFSLVVPSGAQTPVHDHLAWGLVGLYRGTQDEEIYAERGDGLELVESRALAPGDFYALIPPRDDIHRVRTTSPRDVGLDPPADQRHRLRLAPRLRRALGRAHAVSLGLRQRALRRGDGRAVTLHRRLDL